MRDLFHDVAKSVALAPVSLGATGSGGKTSKIIKNDGSLMQTLFSILIGTIGATNAQVLVGMNHGSVTSSLTAVASGDVMGGLAALTAAGIGVTTARASGVSKNCERSVAYIGLKEYVEITLAPKICGGIIASATALQAPLRTLPAGA